MPTGTIALSTMSASGLNYTFTATAVDVVDGVRPVSCSPLPALDVAGGFATELRLEGDEFFDVRLAPVHYRDAPGPRYAGQASSGMPLQEAVLRLTPLPSSEPDFLEKSLSAERGGVEGGVGEAAEVASEQTAGRVIGAGR